MEYKCKVMVIDSKHNIDSSFETKEMIKSGIDRMTSSGASILDDTTPSDSGVQMLDSESSELNESLISSTGFDFDNISNITCDAKTSLTDSLLAMQQLEEPNENVLTKSDIANSNICETDTSQLNVNDEMMSSVHSTFDDGNSENIVYRRRAKKTKTHSTPAPKKRVSFHEDILKNTKTDNIHIEHGFITYKAYPKRCPNGRYSWCSEGDSEDFNENNHVYRNACSDVLDYGKQTEVYENASSNYIHYDNSGVFEYGPHYKSVGNVVGANDSNKSNAGEFYKCNCSDSNSSLDSGSSHSDENGSNYTQAKSNSCDCIGSTNSQNNNMIITENCYYSEPSIEILDESMGNIRKSVWSKDKKPKSSCLKKSKRHTDILVECNLNTKVKKFNVHPLTDMNNLIDNSKMIFGSLKNIFSIPLPERGVPEGSEDLQSVCECIPEPDTSTTNISQKPRPFLSKSLDGGFKDIPGKDKENFVHNVDEQLRRKNDEDLYAPTRQNSRDFVIVSTVTDELDESKNTEELEPNSEQKTEQNYRNKFIINCESTVFEHTGISYCYEEDQSIEIPKTTTPVVPSSMNTNQTLFSAAPLKQKLSSIFKNLTTDSNIDADKNARKIIMSPVVSEKSIIKQDDTIITQKNNVVGNLMEVSMTSSFSDNNSIISDLTTTTTTTTTDQIYQSVNKQIKSSTESTNSPRKIRHLASPAKKSMTTRFERGRMLPDLFNNTSISLSGRESKATMLSEEFDDILTITTCDTDKSDMVIVDYSACDIQTASTSSQNLDTSNNFLKPISSKSSLINRFLRNVTQKKIIDATIKKNTLFAKSVKSEKKLFNNLYPKTSKLHADKATIMADFNAEIALEIELSESVKNKIQSSTLSLTQQPATPSTSIECDKKMCIDIGVGEVSIDVFNGNYLHILRGADEILMKAFKLYTGYNKDGFMTPVLVFLTDKTLYVTDLVRSRLCNKFVLPYSDLDVILVILKFS